MTAIFCIFILVVNAAVLPILCGIHQIVIYEVDRSKIKLSSKKVITFLREFLFALTLIALNYGIYELDDFLCSSKLGGYVAVLIYTFLFSIISSKSLYISPDLKVDSRIKAFKKGFTKMSAVSVLPNLHIRTILEIAYLMFLVLSQVEELSLCTYPASVSLFLILNKYGIVIMVAVEKIIKSINPERDRRKILVDTATEK